MTGSPDGEHDDGPTAPVLILGVSGTPDPTDAPLFAAVHVTQELVDRFQELTDLCVTHKLESVTTTTVEPPLYWDIPKHSMFADIADATTIWHIDGDSISAQLQGRRRLPEGGYGHIENLADTYFFDVQDLRQWREQRYVIAFQTFENHDQVLGAPFALMVYERMVEMRLWPGGPPPPQWSG
jgi:hypothetical protein